MHTSRGVWRTVRTGLTYEEARTVANYFGRVYKLSTRVYCKDNVCRVAVHPNRVSVANEAIQAWGERYDAIQDAYILRRPEEDIG